MPGGFPKKTAVEKIENFDTKTFCEEIGREAWGFIEYQEPLTKGEAYMNTWYFFMRSLLPLQNSLPLPGSQTNHGRCLSGPGGFASD